jgi:hypothetical protein
VPLLFIIYHLPINNAAIQPSLAIPDAYLLKKALKKSGGPIRNLPLH